MEEDCIGRQSPQWTVVLQEEQEEEEEEEENRLIRNLLYKVSRAASLV
jgi:hypothetical protein